VQAYCQAWQGFKQLVTAVLCYLAKLAACGISAEFFFARRVAVQDGKRIALIAVKIMSKCVWLYFCWRVIDKL
jgi:hypothetical protein